MALLNLSGFAMVDSSVGHASLQLAVNCALMLAGFVVIWFFWNGKNWARMLVMLTSVLALFNLRFVMRWSLLVRGTLIAEAVLAVFLLAYLFSPQGRAYFKAGARPSNG